MVDSVSPIYEQYCDCRLRIAERDRRLGGKGPRSPEIPIAQASIPKSPAISLRNFEGPQSHGLRPLATGATRHISLSPGSKDCNCPIGIRHRKPGHWLGWLGLTSKKETSKRLGYARSKPSQRCRVMCRHSWSRHRSCWLAESLSQPCRSCWMPTRGGGCRKINGWP